MGVINRQRLLQEISKGNLHIGPLLDSKQISEASVDLRLGNVACIVRGSGLSHVDPREYKAAEQQGGHAREQGRRRKIERWDIPFGQPLMIHAGTLVLVPTFEWVRLPQNMMGLVTARSSWAREGLNIATAAFIRPGYYGIITLELANFGQIPIALYPGMRIAQIAFIESKLPSREMSRTEKSQYSLSFEPTYGHITDRDEPFVPDTDLVRLLREKAAEREASPPNPKKKKSPTANRSPTPKR